MGTVAVATTVAAAQAPSRLVISHVNVIDVANGAVLSARRVTMVGDRIQSVVPALEPGPTGAGVIDGRGRYLVPGLWDMHTHLAYGRKSVLPALVAHGVTYVRDLGSRLAEIDLWRGEIMSGQLAGPEILRAGPIVNGQSSQSEGRAALETFRRWKGAPPNVSLSWGDALARYRQKLKDDGATDAAADRTIRLIVAHDEGDLYNRIYAAPPEFNTKPNQFLVEAVQGVRPGTALDVAMGQGRNSVFLAGKGWTVTGFDVAEVGLQKAREQAAALGLTITTVHASDEEFEFGVDRWDLIAIIYALEKRSVHRVREALKPGGLVVVEAGRNENADASFGYRSNELLEIFKGFRILKYEETSGTYDWGPEKIQLVRLVGQKPR